MPRLPFIICGLLIASSFAVALSEDIGGSARLIRMSPDIGGSFGVTAAAPPPAPYFDATFDNSGPSQLSDTLTVGSTTLDLALACDNPSTNIASGSWSCRKAGGTLSLTETGSGTSPDYVVGPWGDGYKFARSKATTYNYFASSDSSLDVDGSDMVVELVYRNPAASAGCVGKKNGSGVATDKGWQFRSTSGTTDAPALYVSDGTTQVTITASSSTAGGTAFDAVKHLICFVGKSGASLAQCFANGISAAAATSVNALGSTASTSNFSLLREQTTTGRTCQVAAVRIWKCSSCLTNASDYTTPAAERAEKLMGIRPDVFAGTATVDTHTRGTVAYHRTYDSTAEATYYTQVGAAWLRTERRKIGSTVYNGFLAEPASTNIALRSSGITSTPWTRTNSTATADTIAGPATETVDTGDTLTVSATGTVELIQSVTTTASTTYTSSHFVKRVDSSSPQWVALTTTNVSTCSTNQTLLAWFDVTNCATGQLGTDALRSEVSNMGNGWCRIQATFTTASGATACLPGLRVVDSDGGTAWTGATSGVSLYLWQHQLEVGFRATSPINTTTAAAARNADDLRFNGSNVSSIGNSSVTIDLAMNCPQRATPTTGVDFLEIGDNSSNNRYILATPSATTFNVFRFVDLISGSAQVDMNSTTSVFTDNIKVRSTIATNDVKLYVNETVEATDTSAAVISSWSTGHFRVASRITSASVPPNCMYDRIRIWNSAVSPTVAP